MRVTREAKDKLAWALAKLNVTFKAAIQEERFGEYQIEFREGNKPIRKSIDKRAVDDCDSSGDHITNELVNMVQQVKQEFSVSH